MFAIRKLSELTLLENNPRIIYDDDFARLCQSIKDNPDYFQARPLILSNRTGELVIIAGNQRYQAAKKIGLKEVPTYLIEDLTYEREREIIIRDNVSNGQWNFDLLANEWDAPSLVDWGVKLPVDFNLDNADAEDFEVQEKLPTKFILTIETTIKTNFEEIKRELDRLKIGYVESER